MLLNFICGKRAEIALSSNRHSWMKSKHSQKLNTVIKLTIFSVKLFVCLFVFWRTIYLACKISGAGTQAWTVPDTSTLLHKTTPTAKVVLWCANPFLTRLSIGKCRRRCGYTPMVFNFFFSPYSCKMSSRL